MKQILCLALCVMSLCSVSQRQIQRTTEGGSTIRALDKIAKDTSRARMNVGGEIIKTSIVTEDFESGLGNWTTSYSSTSSSFTPRNWVINNAAPASHPGAVAYGIDFPGGDCGASDQTGRIMLMSPVITLPPAEPGIHWLAFDHYFNFEERLDGGILWYKLNNGYWTPVDVSFFSTNEYNYSPSAEINPFNGYNYFSGAVPNWRRSLVNLRSASIGANNNVQFAWVVSTDGCGGTDGWYIDNIEVYHEQEIPVEPQVEFAVSADSVSEADADQPGLTYSCTKYVDHRVTIKMNKPASQPVTVNLSVLPSQYDSDDPRYDPFYDPTLYASVGAQLDFTLSTTKVIFAPGETSKEISIYVNDDTETEKDETLKIGFNIITSSDAQIGVKNEYTLTIIDDDKGVQDVSTNLAFFNFNDGSIPAGWALSGNEGPYQWHLVDREDPYMFKALAIATDYQDSSVELERYIETSAFNTVGYSKINLSIYQFFTVVEELTIPDGLIDVWTGSEWRNLVTQRKSVKMRDPNSRDDMAVTTVINIPVEFANENMKVRFGVKGTGPLSWFIDDIYVKGTNYDVAIQSESSSEPDEKHLGPNQTVYFYDPETKAILAKIKNLTDHDYGCTSVEIDRAGESTSEWVGYNISDKTVRVIPSNPDPAGKYEITLYYTAAELGDFASSITSMGKSEGGIGVGDASSSTAVPVTVAKYNDDYAFTATFNTGFSGFGLSDAPPSGSLPVKLLSFEGKNANEGNILHWVTSEEVNNDYFAVERSSDAKKFTEISRVPAMTVLSNSNNYYFTDANFSSGKNYYRLKQVDKDGKYAYSGMIAITSENMPGAKLYPNPVQSSITIELPNSKLKSANIRIVNMLGIDVYKKQNVSVKGGKLLQDIGKLQPGVYQVVVSGAESSYTFPIVKQ